MTTVEQLQAARDYLMTHGWHQGGWAPEHSDPAEDGPRCAWGALTQVGCDYVGDRLLDDAAQNLFPERSRTACNYIDLNDHPDTTFNDVLAIFDEAILQAKEAAS